MSNYEKMIITHIYDPSSQPGDYPQDALPDFQISLPKSAHKTTVNSPNKDSFLIEDAPIFASQQPEEIQNHYQQDVAKNSVSDQCFSETPIAETGTNTLETHMVPAITEFETSTKLPSKDASDTKSTTDENTSANRESSPIPQSLTDSTEFQGQTHFVGEPINGVLGPKSQKPKKKSSKKNNSKKPKSKLEKYVSDDAEFNSLRKIIQQEDLNNYFTRINSNLTDSLEQTCLPANCIFGTSELKFNLQQFHSQPKIGEPLLSGNKSGL